MAFDQSTEQTRKPDFLTTFSGKLLFVSGALLLGSSMSAGMTALGFAEVGLARLLVDILFGCGYYVLARFVFLFFQQRLGSRQPKN